MEGTEPGVRSLMILYLFSLCLAVPLFLVSTNNDLHLQLPGKSKTIIIQNTMKVFLMFMFKRNVADADEEF